LVQSLGLCCRKARAFVASGYCVNGQPFFHTVWEMIAVRILGATDQLSGALQGAIGTPFKLCVAAYLLVTMLIAAWSEDAGAFTRFFRNLFLAAVIYSLASNAEAFNYYVSGALHGFTGSVTRAIAGIFGGAPTVTADSFDVIITKAFAVGALVLKGIPWYSPKAVILGAIVAIYWLLVAAATIVIFVVFLLSSIGTEFLIAFGPLFIALYFFPMSRKFFDGWLRCVVAGVLTQIFTIAWLAMFVATLIAMMTSIASSGATEGDGDNIIMKVMTLVLAAGLVNIFATMTAFSAYVAIRIAGGAHIALPRFPAPHAPLSTPTQSSGNRSSGSGGGGSGGGNAGGGAERNQPPSPTPTNRQYAFNRSGA
jgi:type IV secretory pathway VirB6-like protein